MNWDWPPVAEARGQRSVPAVLGSGVPEAAACVALLIVSLVINADHGTSLQWLQIGACLCAALSPWHPRLSGVLTLTAVSIWLLVPEVPGVSMMAVFVPIFTLALRGDVVGRNLLTVAGSGVLFYRLGIQASDSLQEALATMVLIGATVAMVWVIALALRAASDRIAKADEQRKAELREMRMEIARELHDTIASANTSIVLRAEAMRATPGLPDGLGEDLDDIMATGRRSTGQLRTMLALLRSNEDDVADRELVLLRAENRALEAVMAEQVAILRAHGFSVSHELRWNPLSCGRPAANLMAKVMVEAAANMVKHARPGGECLIMIDQTGEALEGLFVNPFDPQVRKDKAVSSGMGLVGLRERVHAAGGNVTISASEPNWMVHVVLPLTGEEDKRELEDDQSGHRRR